MSQSQKGRGHGFRPKSGVTEEIIVSHSLRNQLFFLFGVERKVPEKLLELNTI